MQLQLGGVIGAFKLQKKTKSVISPFLLYEKSQKNRLLCSAKEKETYRFEMS